MVTVVHGTKGGRRRVVDFNTGDAKFAAIKSVENALKILEIQNDLIERKNMQGDCRKYQRELATAGFTGAQASHSLRCSWAKAQYLRHMTATEENKKESLSRLSLDLGHGDGRGRYCKQVYLKNASI